MNSMLSAFLLTNFKDNNYSFLYPALFLSIYNLHGSMMRLLIYLKFETLIGKAYLFNLYFLSLHLKNLPNASLRLVEKDLARRPDDVSVKVRNYLTKKMYQRPSELIK